MVVKKAMKKPVLKISVSDSESSNEYEDSNSDDNTVANEGKQGDENTSCDEDNEKESDIEHSTVITNEGWADSVAKILGSSKPKNKKTLVLSRAKKHSQVTKSENVEKPPFEVIGERKEEKPDTNKDVITDPPAKKIKHEKPSIRVKPNILEKDRERLLNKIATKGVVQLFNAVRNQQKTIEKEMDRNDLPESKKEKILRKFDKREFLDTLMGQSKSIIVDDATKICKNEVKAEEKPKWSALRDDFMTGAKMKDWDKESVDE